MFDDVYDNGDYLLGKVKNVINYIHNLILEERIDDEDAYEILNDIGKMKPDTIISIYKILERMEYLGIYRKARPCSKSSRRCI